MDPFHNPFFLFRILKSYLIDINFIWHTNEKKLRKHQDKLLRKTIKYAYAVPLYKKKYDDLGISPSDIQGIDDLQKLPFTTKDDLRENYPKGIIPTGFDTQHGFLLSTSGSTGKPVFVYNDLFSAIQSLEGFVRALKSYGGSWNKSKITIIIDITPGSAEHAFFTESMSPFLKHFMPLNNIQYLHIDEDPETLIEKINQFQPEFLGSDPNMLRELAYLKLNGKGNNINPKVMFSGGTIIDAYTKQYIEHAFNSKIMDIYGTTEAGPLAFECIDGGEYHVQSDYVYLEFLDEQQKPVSFGSPGHLVVTRFSTGGTPIIRYTGFDDIVVPLPIRTCKSGITTQMIKKIEGRSADLIVLPDGTTLSPFTITGIPAKIMEEYHTYKIKQFQIIQHTVDQIEILIVIDEKLRSIGVPVETLLKELQKRFADHIGPNINVKVTETKTIEKDPKGGYVKVCISKIPHA